MDTVLSTTTALLSNDYVENFSNENLLCKLRKVRKVIGIKFKKIKKTFALFGTYEMIQEAFELLKHWFEHPELEPEGDGTVGEFEQVEMVKNEISWSSAQEHHRINRNLVGDLEEHLVNVDKIKKEIEKGYLSFRTKVDEVGGKNFSQEPSEEKNAEDEKSLEEEKDTNENNKLTLSEAAGGQRNKLKARQSQLNAIKFMKNILKQDKADTPRTNPVTQKLKGNGKISVNISWQKVKKTKKQKSNIDEKIPCNKCNVVVRSRKRLNEHIKRMHLKQFKCILCDKGFGYPTDLHRHKCQRKPELNQDGSAKPRSKKPKQQSLFPCKDCTYIATEKKRFNEHVKRKHMLINKCDKCNKSFGMVKDLERHKENVHAEPKHFCDKCSRFYRSKVLYDSHMKTHEEGYVKPNFTCQICLKSFTTKYVMATHIKNDHLGLKKTWLCSQCGKKFSQRNSYKMHINAHQGIKPYICDLCGKAFTYDKSLKEHKYMHDTVRRFKCKICSKLFRQKTTLHIHMKIHSTSYDHVCKTCGRGFKQKQALERHERIHTGVRPYTCVLCQRTFGDSSTIRRHMLAIHKKSSDNWRDDTITLAKPKSDYYIDGGTGHNKSYTTKSSSMNKDSSSNKTEMSSKDIETTPIEMYTGMLAKKDQTVQEKHTFNGSKELDSHIHSQFGAEFIAEPYHGPLVSVQNAIHEREHSQNLQDGYATDMQYNSFSCQHTVEAVSGHKSLYQQRGTCNDTDSPAFDAHVPSRNSDILVHHRTPQNHVHYTQDDFHSIIEEKQISQNAVNLPVLTPLTSVTGVTAGESPQPLAQNTGDAVLNQAVSSIWGYSGHPAYMNPATFHNYQT